LTLIDYPTELDVCKISQLEKLNLLVEYADPKPPKCSQSLTGLNQLRMTSWGYSCSDWANFFVRASYGAPLKDLGAYNCELPSIPQSVEQLSLESFELADIYN